MVLMLLMLMLRGTSMLFGVSLRCAVSLRAIAASTFAAWRRRPRKTLGPFCILGTLCRRPLGRRSIELATFGLPALGLPALG